MVMYEGVKCIKTDKGTWVNELVKKEFTTFNDCTRYIDIYFENKNRKQILILGVIALIASIISVSVAFIVR